MGYEKTEPRNNQILLWGVISVLTLFALVPLFHSYFGLTFGAEFAEKIYEVPNTPYEELRDGQRASLRTAPISVEQAMEQLAARGRANTPVMPRPNDTPDVTEEDYEASLAPVVGWAQLQRERDAEAARRAMRFRRQVLAQEAGVDDPAATTVEGMDNTEEADPPSPAVTDTPEPPPAREPVRRPPSQLRRPTAMVAGAGMAPTMVAEPTE